MSKPSRPRGARLFPCFCPDAGLTLISLERLNGLPQRPRQPCDARPSQRCLTQAAGVGGAGPRQLHALLDAPQARDCRRGRATGGLGASAPRLASYFRRKPALQVVQCGKQQGRSQMSTRNVPAVAPAGGAGNCPQPRAETRTDQRRGGKVRVGGAVHCLVLAVEAAPSGAGGQRRGGGMDEGISTGRVQQDNNPSWRGPGGCWSPAHAAPHLPGDPGVEHSRSGASRLFTP